MADWQDEVRAAQNKKDDEKKRIKEIELTKKAIVKKFWDQLILANEELDHDIRLSTGKMELLVPMGNDDYGNPIDDFYHEGMVEYIASKLGNKLLFYDDYHDVIAEGYSSGDKIFYRYEHEVKRKFIISNEPTICDPPMTLRARDLCVYEDETDFRTWYNIYEIDNSSIDILLRNLALSSSVMYDGLKPVKHDELNKEDKVGKCFIATSIYGSRFSPEVITLQDLRDQVLLKNSLGEIFVKFYYFYSPPIAEIISGRKWLQELVRKGFLQFCVSYAQWILKSRAGREARRS